MLGESPLAKLIDLRNAKPIDMPQKMWEYTEAYYSFFGKEFARLDFLIEDDYILTALFANQIYAALSKVEDNGQFRGDGIMYLSIASGLKGINYTLSSRALHKIKLVGACDVMMVNRSRENISSSGLPHEIIEERLSKGIKDGIIH